MNTVFKKIKRHVLPQAFSLTLFLSLLFAVGQAQAQTDIEKQIQQMEEEIASGKLSDDEVFERYDILCSNFKVGFEKAIDNSHKAIAYAHKKKNEEQEIMYLTHMGDLYTTSNVMDSAQFYFDKAQKLLEGKQYYEMESYYYKNRGRYYFVVNDFENAMKHFLKGLEVLRKDKAQKIANKQNIDEDIFDEVVLLNNIGNLYDYLKRENKAMEYMVQAKKVMDDNPNVNFKNYKPTILTNLANLYMSEDQYEKALQLMKELYKLTAAKAKDGTKEMAAFANVLILFTKYYEHMDNIGKSLEYGKQALQVAEEVNEKLNSDMARDLVNTANLILMYAYFQIKDYKTSTNYAEQILELSSKSEFIGNPLIEAYQHLALNYAAMGNPKEARRCMIKYQELIKTRTDESIHEAVHEMEIKYEIAEKQNEIEGQKIELSRRKSQQIALGSVLIATAALLVLLAYIVVLRSRRTRALTEMNAIKDKFFSIISHDLKNPVVTQRNALQILTSHMNQWDTNTISDYSEKLLKQSDDLVDLLKNLLNWSLIQSGRNAHYPIMFNLVAALQSDINVIRSMAERKNITFETLTPKTVIVTADQNMLTTVVRNLLANAVKFTAEGGKITLEITEENEKYTVSVADTGIGMSQAHINNLFRLESAHSHPGTAGEQGSALGLIVCKEMLEKHGSTLYVESTEGVGSKFWFTI